MSTLNWNSDFMFEIYHNLWYDENVYPPTQVGIIMFLKHCFDVDFDVYKSDDSYTWTSSVIISKKKHVIDYDLTEYKTFDDALNSAIVETVCFLDKNLKI